MYELHGHYKKYKVGKWTTSNIEISDITKAWLAISVAFAIVLGGFSISTQMLWYFLIAAVGVGTGFILHEMGHKLVAQRYGCFAEFRADYPMLMLAIVMSFFGFVFAAPGAVYITGGQIDVKRNGKISVAGPLINMVLAIVFGAAFYFTGSVIFRYGMMINAWIGLFNLIPFAIFDGAKIWRWSRGIWLAMVAFGLLLTLGPSFL